MTTQSGRRRRWPAALRHDGHDFLTTAQTARVLGVRESTVYAYVSRGMLTSVRIAGMRGSYFAVDEIEAFRRRVERRPPVGVVERIRTEITLLQDDRLYYRGRSAVELARTASFEEVAHLLWDSPPDVAGVCREELFASDPIAGVATDGVRGVDVIRMVVDVLGARDPDRHDLSTPRVVAVAETLLGAVAETLPLRGRRPSRSESSFAQRLWPRLTAMSPTRTRVATLNAALVLLADHDLSAGAVAARVAASARGSVYAVVSAGLGAFDGPLHGGATALAQDFLTDVTRDPAGPADAVASRAASGPLPGCGHVVHRHSDPRARDLLRRLETDRGPRSVMAAVDAIAARTGADGGFVNSDLALGALAVRYRMTPDAAQTIFAVARIAGWVAHAIEEYREPRLRFRPEGVYVGVRPGVGATGRAPNRPRNR